jgi:hypothetical protein
MAEIPGFAGCSGGPLSPSWRAGEILDVDRPIGAHVFTAREPNNGDANM